MKRHEDPREVAHDLNNLLTAIIGAADAALERTEIDPETRADIAHIREGARRGSLLVRRLSGDPNDIAVPPDFIFVNQTIRESCRLLAHRAGSGVTFTLDLVEPDGQAMADPSQLDRVLLNLVANADHAMPNGGTVTLSTAHRVVDATETHVPDTIPPGDYVVVTVADTGSGIADDQMSRIFESGFSSRHDAGGSGLGLTSVRDIVHQSGGFLSVVSIDGHGSRFNIYLPAAGAASPPALPEATLRGVLLVDDDPLVRGVAERALRRAGWIVRCASSGGAALEILRQTGCDLMISDIAMPGMDGVTLARLALARQPGLPIILTSGYERAAEPDGGEVTNVAFLAKPYGQAELLATVARIAG